MLVGVGLELTVFLVVGAVIDRARPAAESLHSTPSTPSFPSGHVAMAVVLYGSLVLVARLIAPPGRVTRGRGLPVPRRRDRPVVEDLEGVHYPTDVAVGALFGAGALTGSGGRAGAGRRPVRAEVPT